MKSLSLALVLGGVSAVVGQVAPYGQCGGSGWTGGKTCTSGYCCVVSNEWYSQCVQSSSCGGATTAAGTTAKVTTAKGTTAAGTRTTTRAATTTAGSSAAATTYCDQYGGLTTTNNYNINNNNWGMDAATSGSQCTYYKGIVGSGVAWGTSWTWAGGQYNVKSYASAGKVVTPKILSTINSMPTTWKWSYTGSNMVCNVAYDLFTSSNSAAATYNGEYEMMIWVAAYGGAGPISATGSPIATVTIAGYSWNLYYGLNGTMKVFSFVTANGAITSFSGDIKLFYNYLISSQGYPSSNQYLLAFQAGSEPFTGTGRLDVSEFSAAVN